MITGTAVASMFTASAFAADYKIAHNGNNSNNDIDVEEEYEVDVDQENNTMVVNNFSVVSNTGANNANKNTGNGNAKISTGDTATKIMITNGGSMNNATVKSQKKESAKLVIKENGNNSDNDIDVDVENEVEVDQENNTTFVNLGSVVSNTGDNAANKNTGKGNKKVKTGHSYTEIVVTNKASKNKVKVK